MLGFHLITDEPGMLGLETGALRLFVEKAPASGPVLDFLVGDIEAAKAPAGCRIVEEDPSVPRYYVRDPFGLTFNLGRLPALVCS